MSAPSRMDRAAPVTGGAGLLLAGIGITLTAVGASRVGECSDSNEKENSGRQPRTSEGATYRAAVEAFNARHGPAFAKGALPAVFGDFSPSVVHRSAVASAAAAAVVERNASLEARTMNISGDTYGIETDFLGARSTPLRALFEWNNPPMTRFQFRLGAASSPDGSGSSEDGSSSLISLTDDVVWQKSPSVEARCVLRKNEGSSGSSTDAVAEAVADDKGLCSRDAMEAACDSFFAAESNGGEEAISGWFAPWTATLPCAAAVTTQSGGTAEQRDGSSSSSCGKCSWNLFLSHVAVVVTDATDAAVSSRQEGEGPLPRQAHQNEVTSPRKYALSSQFLSPFYPFSSTEGRYVYTNNAGSASPPRHFAMSVFIDADPLLTALNVTGGTLNFSSSSLSSDGGRGPLGTGGAMQQQQERGNVHAEDQGGLRSLGPEGASCASERALLAAGVALLVIGLVLIVCFVALKWRTRLVVGLRLRGGWGAAAEADEDGRPLNNSLGTSLGGIDQNAAAAMR